MNKKSVRNSLLRTKVREAEAEERAPSAGSGIPPQPPGRTTVEQMPTLQPTEDPALEQTGMP